VRIEAVATDLSPASSSAVLTHLPNAVPGLDHFPIIKLYNEGLSDLRRKLYHEATHVMDQKVLKGTRGLLLKNPENGDPNRREPERLAAALQLNQPLALAYYLKEDLRQIWQQSDKAAAAILQDWEHGKGKVGGVMGLEKRPPGHGTPI
jgi:transposase